MTGISPFSIPLLGRQRRGMNRLSHTLRVKTPGTYRVIHCVALDCKFSRMLYAA